jgi:ATHILA ORF-1 family protein
MVFGSKKRKSGKEPQGSTSQNPQQDEQPPPPLPPLKFHNKNHKTIYDNLQNRKFRPTKNYHQPSTTKLGIDDDCWFLFNNLRLGSFMASAYRTYKEPTFEFLASFECHAAGERDLTISFQLFNKKETLNLRQFNQLLDLNPDADMFFPEHESLHDYNPFEWWKCISRMDAFNAK